jgi:two-component system OmpR family response regulator
LSIKKNKILAGITFYLPPDDLSKRSIFAASRRRGYDATVKKILIFEEDEELSSMVEQAFCVSGGFKVMIYGVSARPLEKIRRFNPDAVILDLNISPVSGWDVIKMIRHDRVYCELPVVLVSGHYKSAADISSGYEDFCADGYVVKPFSPAVMVSLVKSILRRASKAPAPPTGSHFRFNGLLINQGRHEISSGRIKVNLTPMEFALFVHLSKNAGRICSRAELISVVDTRAGETTCTRAIDRHIASIRRKISGANVRIRSVYGGGYIMEESAHR